MKNAFLKKSCTKCSGETSHRPCLKSEIEHISGLTVLKFQTVCFYCMSKSRTTKTY